MRTKGERIQVRVVKRASITEKQFKQVVTTSTRLTPRQVHPSIVLADLRRGCLASLTSYLSWERGIPDRAVAVELRKLISGSVHRSHYRLLVIEHPDSPKDEGGRPRKPSEKTLTRYRHMVASYEESLLLERGKAYLARERVAAKFGCDDKTVKRAIATLEQERVKDQEKARKDKLDEHATAETLEHRRAALRKLRRGDKVRSV